VNSPYGNYAYAVLTAQALRAPEAIAITYCGTEQISYDTLNRRVNRRTHALAAAGVKPGTPVASLLHATLNVTELYLAEAKLGAVLAAMNPYWPDDVLVGVVEQAGCPAFVYDAHFDDLVARIRPRLPGVTLWLRIGGALEGAVDLDALAAASPEDEPELGAHYDDPMAYFYTSGTTGLPKAVVHTHASSVSVAQVWLDLPKAADSVFATGPIIWGIGFTAIAGPALYGGVRLALENDFGPAHFLTVAPRERVTHISVIPSFWSQLLADDAHASVDLSSLRAVLIGGEPLLPSLLQRITERVPQAQIFSYYGQTEAPYTCFGRLDDGSQPQGAAGRARTTCAVAVTDSAGNRVMGEVGEIRLAGPHLLREYAGQPDRTAEVLHDGWYVGGDLGTVDAAGVLTVLGRREDAILKQGTFTQPSQVEEAAAALDGVAEAGAVGVPEGAGEQQVLLTVVARAGHTLDPDAVSAALRDRLPDAAQPDLVIVVDALPHAQDASGGQGKLLRREIRARWGSTLAPVP
jgi:acyl-CoA synthetase (AMP-forming)/AMP-acid ligase II